jgi:hypothetical protein
MHSRPCSGIRAGSIRMAHSGSMVWRAVYARRHYSPLK